jgi:hypothetical protein
MHLRKRRMAMQLMATVFLFVIILAVPRLSAQTAPNHPATSSNEQDARPPVTRTDFRIAKRARALLKSESTWNRADIPHIEGDQTTACQPSAKQMSLYCALERATVEVSGKFEHRGAVMQEARFVIEDAEPQWATKYQHLLVDYNNDPHTTFQDIQKVLQSIEQHISKRLRDND